MAAEKELRASGLSALLQQVTQRKLDNLVVQRDRHATKQRDALREANAKADAVESVTTLIAAIEDKLIERQVDELGDCPLALMKQFLKQACYDPTITVDMVGVWRAQLERSISVFQNKIDSSILFSQLVADWAKSVAAAAAAASESRSAAQEQRAEWESFAFSDRTIDKDAIHAYLKTVFAKRRDEDDDMDEEEDEEPLQGKHVKKTPIEELRESVKDHEDEGWHMSTHDVQNSIKSVLASDLFAGAKHAALKDLSDRPEVLREICDILNQDLLALEFWQWAASPMDMDVRRHVNGKYRVYLDEEVYQAIFLDYIGTNWARHFRSALCDLYNDLWKHDPANGLTRAEKSRRKGMVWTSAREAAVSMADKRKRAFYSMWLVNLNEVGGYEGDGDASYATDVKQSMLRMITAEASIQQGLGREFTLLQSDFRWFGPSMPHSTIEAVLTFFGMSKRWIGFFRTFLTPTLRFRADGDVPGRARTCGVPMSHIISTMLGELVLASLDFAVNKATKGGYLYRNHDDIWFFGTYERCTTAWKTLQHFTTLMGLELNQDKTAAVTLKPRTPDDQHFVTASMAKESEARDGEGLPWGTVRWGFLYMDAESCRWEMDEAQLVEHAKEFKLQLAATTSIMAWTRVWDGYLRRFFVNNFGKTSLCMGHRHAEICQRAFAIVQKTVFDGTEAAAQANVAAYVRAALLETYGETATNHFVDGMLYFPRGVGGLEIHNPLVELTMELQAEYDDVGVLVREAMQDTRAAYKRTREGYEEKGAYRARDPFMSWEEYALRSPEETNEFLGKLYGRLTSGAEKGVQEDEIPSAEAATKARFKLAGITKFLNVAMNGSGKPLDAYWTRIVELYGNEVVRKYGSLVICEPKDLPLGLVNFILSEKVRWKS